MLGPKIAAGTISSGACTKNPHIQPMKIIADFGQ